MNHKLEIVTKFYKEGIFFNLLKGIFTCLLIASCSKTNKPQKTTNDTSPPNVIVILTDDQGYGDVGYTGNPYIKTPNLDELRTESAFLSNFYVSPVCSPTRASILTGKFSIRTGIYDTFNGGALMDGEEITIAEILKDNGYKTGIFGKWHLGSEYPLRPSDQGFDESLNSHGGGIGQPGDPINYPRSKVDSSYFDPYLYHNNKVIPTKGYCTDIFTDYTLEFIENNKSNPFFAFVTYNTPHIPLQLPQKYYDMYKDLEFVYDENADHNIHPKINKGDQENARKIYGMVTNIDDNVGRIITKLEQENLLDNTIVCFLSDNGPRFVRYNADLRGQKSSTYDGGTKSPLIIRYPKKIEKNSEIKTVSAHVDLLPTILDLCDLELPSELDLDGLSLANVFKGDDDAHFYKRNIYEQWARMHPERYRNMSVRKGHFKLRANGNYETPLDKFELYNTESDPSETTNVINKHPEIAKQLKAELDAWFHQEVVVNENPKLVYLSLNPEKSDTLMLTRNDLKGAPEYWTKDYKYGYWDINVEKEGHYDVLVQFHNTAEKRGSLFVKQAPLSYSIDNKGIDKTTLTIKNVFLKNKKGPLDVFYRTGFNEVTMPFTVKIYESQTQ